MKNLIVLIGLAVVFNCSAQFGKSVQLLGSGTLNGLDSVLLKSNQMSQTNGFIGIHLIIDTTRVGAGTSTAIAKASLIDSDDHNDWGTLTTVDYVVYTNNNDTVTMDTPAGSLWGITALPFDYVGLYLHSVAGDTLDYEAWYVGKEYK